MKTNTQKTVTAAMLAALCCIATMIIRIPSPLKGYINLGDCVVLLSGCLLSPVYGFAAAGIGSAFADIFSGYFIYAGATFIIKGLMALIMHCSLKKTHNKPCNTSARIVGGILAEATMIIGYYLFEGFLYGFSASLVNMPANCIQGIAGLIMGIILINVFEKTKMFK